MIGVSDIRSGRTSPPALQLLPANLLGVAVADAELFGQGL